MRSTDLCFGIKRRHPNKNGHWQQDKYFRSRGGKNWIFFALTKGGNGKKKCLDLLQAAETPIKRHVKIRAEATPFNPAFTEYFRARKQSRNMRCA